MFFFLSRYFEYLLLVGEEKNNRVGRGRETRRTRIIMPFNYFDFGNIAALAGSTAGNAAPRATGLGARAAGALERPITYYFITNFTLVKVGELCSIKNTHLHTSPSSANEQ